MVSCQYFDKQVPSKDELLEKELKSINWQEVDEFPSVADCDSVTDKVMRRQCFLDFLVTNIQQRLNAEPLKVLYPDLDTIQMKVTIFPDSHVQFEPKLSDSLIYGKATVDSVLQARLADFPPVKPALKRDIPVKTQFVLPVVLEVKR
ncbi:hypothetical protein HUK80_07095 [Flavobacterium sp. MAH-1]|uniref:TonB C-terminal domain-containing protein n=2 Tax=Flavobacterium agri TaxID=2743471 RepID=A0A7Y8Y159_9FLAO|nr:hypothetical protein [Flavobacterium agri]NYA70679.1 hypothetical protein [Flavobacterium agri]